MAKGLVVLAVGRAKRLPSLPQLSALARLRWKESADAAFNGCFCKPGTLSRAQILFHRAASSLLNIVHLSPIIFELSLKIFSENTNVNRSVRLGGFYE